MSVHRTFAPSCLSPEPTSNFRKWFNFPAIAANTAAGLLIVASAGFGGHYAWTTGSTHGTVLAALALAMALGLELAKPLAVVGTMAAIREWKAGQALALATLATVAIAYSLTAELSLMARSRADTVAARADTAIKAKDARGARDRAQAELAMLGPTRPAAELAPLLKSAKVLAKDCRNIQTGTQREACKSLPALESELARAPRFEELKQAAAMAEATLATTSVRAADPGSVALASYLAALGFTVDPSTVGDWLVLVGVLALEVGSALGGVLARTAGGGRFSAIAPDVLPSPQPEQSPSLPLPAQPIATGVPVPVLGANSGPSGNTRSKVLALIQNSGGSVRGSQRTLADQLGVSPSRLNSVLGDLASEGVVKMRTGSTGTVLALA